MNTNIKHILDKGEGITVEYKRCSRQLPESFFETVCAFLNRDGGIAQLFTQMGRSEELGTGIRNVFKYSKAYSGSDKK